MFTMQTESPFPRRRRKRRCLDPYSHGNHGVQCGCLSRGRVGSRMARCDADAGVNTGLAISVACFFFLGPDLATLLLPPLLSKDWAALLRVWGFFAGGAGVCSDLGRIQGGYVWAVGFGFRHFRRRFSLVLVNLAISNLTILVILAILRVIFQSSPSHFSHLVKLGSFLIILVYLRGEYIYYGQGARPNVH